MSRILLINNNSIFINELTTLIPEAEVWPVQSVSAEVLAGFDVVIVSGGTAVGRVAEQRQECLEEIALLKKIKVPLLGICLGFQLLCNAYGADLQLIKERRRGLVEVTVFEPEDPLLKGVPQKFFAYGSHRWGAQKPGSELIVLGRSEDGIEIIKHKTLPHYGIQFHPEKSDPEFAAKIIENFRRLAGQR